MNFATPHSLNWQLFKILLKHVEYNHLRNAEQHGLSHTGTLWKATRCICTLWPSNSTSRYIMLKNSYTYGSGYMNKNALIIRTKNWKRKYPSPVERINSGIIIQWKLYWNGNKRTMPICNIWTFYTMLNRRCKTQKITYSTIPLT